MATSNNAQPHLQPAGSFMSEGALNSMRQKLSEVSDQDYRVWLLLTAVPQGMSKPFAAICCALNVFIPGLGTVIASFLGRDHSKTLLAMGLVQFFLAYILVGWILSIYWGYLFIKEAFLKGEESQPIIGGAAGAHQASSFPGRGIGGF